MATTKKQLMVDNWNLKYPSTMLVKFWKGLREGIGVDGYTWSPAELLGGHTPVVFVRDLNGKNHGAVALTHVEAVRPKY